MEKKYWFRKGGFLSWSPIFIMFILTNLNQFKPIPKFSPNIFLDLYHITVFCNGYMGMLNVVWLFQIFLINRNSVTLIIEWWNTRQFYLYLLLAAGPDDARGENWFFRVSPPSDPWVTTKNSVQPFGRLQGSKLGSTII